MATGPGELDSEGIWLFGEADNETLMSDTLNLGQSATSAAFTLDRGRIQELEDSASGLTAITPTTITGGTADSTGLITFTNAAGLYLDGCFTSIYKKFRVDLGLQLLSSAVPYLRLRASGTTDTSAAYDKQRLLVSNASVSAAQQTAQVRWDMGIAAFAGYNIITMELANVAQALATVGRVRNDATPNPMTASGGFQEATVQHRTASAFDGLEILASSGNISGWAKVYGYA